MTKKKETRGREVPRMKGKRLFNSCVINGHIENNCMFKLIMGYEDSRLKVDKRPIVVPATTFRYAGLKVERNAG